MIQAAFGGTPFSTKVDAWLEIDGQRIAVSHVGGDRLRTRGDIVLPASEGCLMLKVDDDVTRVPIRLPDGIQPDGPRTRFEVLGGRVA